MKLLVVLPLLVMSTFCSYSYKALEGFTDRLVQSKKMFQESLRNQESVNDVDINTFSNYKEVKQQHYNINWNLDLNNQKVSGSVELIFTTLVDDFQKVFLDMWDQEITNISFTDEQDEKVDLEFTIHHFTEEEEGDQGQQLQITLPKTLNTGDEFNLEITYSFGPDANAVSFLTPEQTGTKTQPYLYSQGEPIYIRSMIPLQDTPMVKSTYNADVIAQKDINVYMSANKTDVTQVDIDHRKHSFENSIVIPSYLVAIIAGNVEEQQVGARTYVIAEPDMIEKSVDDLGDLELYLETVENYTQLGYIWGTYKIVIMPPSFPFGGMENPLLTFASPSIIVGDKSGTTVAIHEIAHSWTGNMVTCGNWSNMWINEGFTVYLERQAQQTLFGKDFKTMDSIVGNSTFVDDITYFGDDNSFSSLFPLTAHRNPDDSFSTVPYEKGYQFLTFIESLITSEKMEQLLNKWIAAGTFQSRVWEDFRDFFNNWIQDNVSNPDDVVAQIDWTAWVMEPGIGPIEDVEKIHFSTEQETNAVDLAQAWIDADGQKPDDWESLNDYSPNQKYVFLGYLYQNIDSVNSKILATMEDAYDFNNSPNYEICWRWFQVTILGGYEQAKESVFEFLGKIGRQKMITPQYKAYVIVGQRDYAAEVFAHYYDFYHPIARISIEQILASTL